MDRSASIDFAKRYVEDLLSFFGLNTDVAARCDDEEEVIEISIPSTYLNGFLIGQRGETLRSLQLLLSMSLKNKDAALTRVNIDVASYKKHRADRVEAQVKEWCQQVMDSGKKMELKSMSPADRRTAHRVVADYPELLSHSEGEGRERHLIIEKNKDGK